MRINELAGVVGTTPGSTTLPPAIGASTGAGASMMTGAQPMNPADKAKQQRRESIQKQIEALQAQLNRLQMQQANIK